MSQEENGGSKIWGAGRERAPGESLSVLVADHSSAMRDNLARLLTVLSLDVCGMAQDGREMVDLSVRHRPDLVMMDILVPGLPGIELLNEIRKTLPDSRVIILTTESERDIVLDCRRLGASAYVLKPFEWDFLRDTIIRVARSLREAPKPGKSMYGVMRKAGGQKAEVALRCESCGCLNLMDHRYCGYCGQSLSNPAPVAALPGLAPDPAPENTYFSRLAAEARDDKLLFLSALRKLSQPDIEEIFHDETPAG